MSSAQIHHRPVANAHLAALGQWVGAVRLLAHRGRYLPIAHAREESQALQVGRRAARSVHTGRGMRGRRGMGLGARGRGCSPHAQYGKVDGLTGDHEREACFYTARAQVGEQLACQLGRVARHGDIQGAKDAEDVDVGGHEWQSVRDEGHFGLDGSLGTRATWASADALHPPSFRLSLVTPCGDDRATTFLAGNNDILVAAEPARHQ